MHSAPCPCASLRRGLLVARRLPCPASSVVRMQGLSDSLASGMEDVLAESLGDTLDACLQAAAAPAAEAPMAAPTAEAPVAEPETVPAQEMASMPSQPEMLEPLPLASSPAPELPIQPADALSGIAGGVQDRLGSALPQTPPSLPPAPPPAG